MDDKIEAIKKRISDRLFNKMEQVSITTVSRTFSAKIQQNERVNNYSKRIKSKLSRIPILGYLLLWCSSLFKLQSKFREIDSKVQMAVNNTAQANGHLDSLSINYELLNQKFDLFSQGPQLDDQFETKLRPFFSSLDNLETDESGAYKIFNDRFSGSKEYIAKLQQIYIKDVKQASVSAKQGKYFLDVGCGTGGFLELLSKTQIPAKGIEINQTEYRNLIKEGCNVELEDANSFLGKIDDSLLMGLSAFQVIEHMNYDYLKDFLGLAYEKISPGGIIILESINTKCSFALNNFFTDFSHIKPYPAESLNFLVEKHGFRNIKIRYSLLAPEPFRIKTFIEYNYLNYAVIGWKK